MSKRRIIVPNPKIEKNDIGKKDKKFNDIYTNNIESVNISTDNINTEKINGEIIDEERYLENQFTIIYPGGGNADNPGVIQQNTVYVNENPFPGYYVNCIPEILINGEWGYTDYQSFESGSYGYYRSCGVITHQHNDNKIVTTTGYEYLIYEIPYINQINGTTFNSRHDALRSAPARIKIWKVGKIK